MNLLDYQQEIFQIYQYALIHIGVDFSLAEVQEALFDCPDGMEGAFQSTIRYWYINNYQIENPNAFLIKALYEQWQPFQWQPEWLNHPNFKSPCQKWWEDAAIHWGQDLRNSLVADVSENEHGIANILFTNGQTLTLSIARRLGWERVLDYIKQHDPNFRF